jgi:hypothetical protein
MEAVHAELKRLGRARARATGGRWAARAHLGLLLGALVLACVHRIVTPLPVLDWIDDRWPIALLAGVGLFAVGWALARVLGRWMRPRPLALAQHLDERYAWRDETTTAAGLDVRAAKQPVPALLVKQTAGRLRGVGNAAMGTATHPKRWPRVLLAFLFVFVLLAPGVQGLTGLVGAGPHVEPGEGREAALEPVGPPRPMRADFWLQGFVQNPLPVEPLPEAADQEAPR